MNFHLVYFIEAIRTQVLSHYKNAMHLKKNAEISSDSVIFIIIFKIK